MSSNVKYLTFYENWRKNKKWCTPEEWYELEDIILQLRFDGIDTDPDTIENEKIAMIWNNIRPSILKSNRDKRYNDSKKNKQSSNILQDTVGDEFNVMPVTNNIPNNEEIENKAILSHQNSKDDNLYHPIEESGLNSLKMANNKEFEIEVNERKSIPTVKINNTSVKPAKNTPSFQDVVKAYSNQINDIINDFKDGSPLRKMQGETRMSELLNTRAGKIYREEITNLINEQVKSSIIEQGISPVEQVQELINNDDNFYRVFTNCVKMLSSDEPQESATNKLISLFNEYNVPYNKQVRDFIAEEIYYHINNKDEYAA